MGDVFSKTNSGQGGWGQSVLGGLVELFPSGSCFAVRRLSARVAGAGMKAGWLA